MAWQDKSIEKWRVLAGKKDKRGWETFSDTGVMRLGHTWERKRGLPEYIICLGIVFMLLQIGRVLFF